MEVKCICGKTFEGDDEKKLQNQLQGHHAYCDEYKESKGKKVDKSRPKRQPLGVKTAKLYFGEPPKNMVMRIVNDNWHKKPTRIQDALDGGYVFLYKDSDGKLGTTDKHGNKNMGSRISRTVGVNDDGSPITGYLMGIDKHLYEQDQKEKQKRPDAIDRAILGGTLEDDGRQRRYSPDGIQIDNQFRN